MSITEIATKQDIAALEERLKTLLLVQFDLLIQELRLLQLKDAVADERLTKKEVCKLLHLSPNSIDKLEHDKKLIVENWGDGKKRIPRYPKFQFIRVENAKARVA